MFLIGTEQVIHMIMRASRNNEPRQSLQVDSRPECIAPDEGLPIRKEFRLALDDDTRDPVEDLLQCPYLEGTLLFSGSETDLLPGCYEGTRGSRNMVDSDTQRFTYPNKESAPGMMYYGPWRRSPPVCGELRSFHELLIFSAS